MIRYAALILLCVFIGCDGLTIDMGTQPVATPNAQPHPQPQVEVLAFTAEWCSACNRDVPQIAEMRKSGVRVTVIDVDRQPELARRHGITSLPTYIVMEDGVEVERTTSILAIVSVVITILKIAIKVIPFLI